MSFWDQPRHGANSFNQHVPDEAYFRALRSTGATWVRLTFSKWKGHGRDFLLGDADHYAGIPSGDLSTLVGCLDAAAAAGLGVVVVPLSLPGARWVQQNGGVADQRLWTSRAYWDESAAFWRDLATALKGHPAVVGYNLLNEPVPEKGAGLDEQAGADARVSWYTTVEGSPRDLVGFYESVIHAIREVDEETPILLDAGWYAHAWGFAYWPRRLGDDKLLYSFHMYEPYEATSAPNIHRDPQLRYPGVESTVAGATVRWDRAMVGRFLDGPTQWGSAHGVPPLRLVASEFGCVRHWSDCGSWLGDVLDTLDGKGVHWAFYGFREDEWDAMDYELAPDVTSGQFYWLHEQGKADRLRRTPHPLLDVIGAHMR